MTRPDFDLTFQNMFDSVEHMLWFEDLALETTMRNGGSIALVQFLIDNGAKKELALELASEMGDFPFVQSLLEQGVDARANYSHAYRSAVFNRHLSIVKLLLEYGADINAVDGRALMHAIYTPSILKFLLECGADVSTNRALEWAYSCERHEEAKLIRSIRKINSDSLTSVSGISEGNFWKLVSAQVHTYC
jgi:hypothetical protein